MWAANSPPMRVSIARLSCRGIADRLIGHDQVHRNVVGLRVDRLQCRVRVAQADRIGSRHRRGEYPIKVASAIAETKSGRVESNQGLDDHVGYHHVLLSRNGDIPDSPLHWHARVPPPELYRAG